MIIQDGSFWVRADHFPIEFCQRVDLFSEMAGSILMHNMICIGRQWWRCYCRIHHMIFRWWIYTDIHLFRSIKIQMNMYIMRPRPTSWVESRHVWEVSPESKKPHLCCKLASTAWNNRVGWKYEEQATAERCFVETRPLKDACCRFGEKEQVAVRLKQSKARAYLGGGSLLAGITPAQETSLGIKGDGC